MGGERGRGGRGMKRRERIDSIKRYVCSTVLQPPARRGAQTSRTCSLSLKSRRYILIIFALINFN